MTTRKFSVCKKFSTLCFLEAKSEINHGMAIKMEYPGNKCPFNKSGFNFSNRLEKLVIEKIINCCLI